MTWTEFRDRLSENPVVLLPLGAQEEQGPTAPMGDFMLAEMLASEVALRTDAIVAPTIPFGDSEMFRSFPGCMSLRPETLVSLLFDVCANLIENGVERIVLLNGQTGNAPHIDTATRRLRSAYGIMLPCIPIWRIFPVETWRGLLGAEGETAQTGHGGDPITSVFMHFRPDLVRQDLMPERQPWNTAIGLTTCSVSSVDFKGVPIGLPLQISEMSKSGVLSGDSHYSSPKIGAAISEFIIAFAADFVRHFKNQSPHAA